MGDLLAWLPRLASRTNDACDAVRFAAGMTMVASVFAVVQALLLAEETIAVLRRRRESSLGRYSVRS